MFGKSEMKRKYLSAENINLLASLEEFVFIYLHEN